MRVNELKKRVTFRMVVLALVAFALIFLLIIFVCNWDTAIEAFKVGWSSAG